MKINSNYTTYRESLVNDNRSLFEAPNSVTSASDSYVKKFALLGDKIIGGYITKELLVDNYSVARTSKIVAEGLSNEKLKDFSKIVFPNLPVALQCADTVEAFVGVLIHQIDRCDEDNEPTTSSRLNTVLQCFLEDLLEFVLATSSFSEAGLPYLNDISILELPALFESDFLDITSRVMDNFKPIIDQV